ncbi:MAG: WG repeat-containing protein [Catonella sp.]|uniref:WG repeat-containing protein n=1 Tax=Catonella sp. TaxID=2382125 RepID=UPI003F9F0438
MLKRISIKLSLGLLLAIVIGTFNLPVVYAAESKIRYGAAMKDGKLYSIEINGESATTTLCDESNPIGKGYEGNYFIMPSNITGERFYKIFDKYGKNIETLSSKEYDIKAFKADGEGNKEYGGTELNKAYDFVVFTSRDDENAINYIYTNEKGLFINKYDEEVFEKSEKDSLVVKKNDKMGVINKLGEEVVNCEYDDITFIDGYIAVADKDEKIEYTDIRNKKKLEYDHIIKSYALGSKKEIYRAVVKNKKCGIINSTSKEIIPVQYDDMVIDSDGFRVIKNNKFGFLDLKGKVILPCKYNYLGEFSEGLALSGKKYDWTYINKKGKKVLHFKYEDMGNLSNGLIPAKNNGKWGYINKKGKKIIDFKYDDVNQFENGYATVMKNDEWGLINRKGKEIFEFNSDSPILLNQYGIAVIEKNRKYGLINKAGKIIYPCKSVQPIRFYEYGIARAIEDGKYIFITKNGNTMQSEVDHIMCSKELILVHKENHTYWLYNSQGIRLTDKDYLGNTRITKDDLAILIYKGDNKFMYSFKLVDGKMNEVIPEKYYYVAYSDGYYIVKTKEYPGKLSIFTKTGKQLIPFEYEMAYVFD